MHLRAAPRNLICAFALSLSGCYDPPADDTGSSEDSTTDGGTMTVPTTSAVDSTSGDGATDVDTTAAPPNGTSTDTTDSTDSSATSEDSSSGGSSDSSGAESSESTDGSSSSGGGLPSGFGDCINYAPEDTCLMDEVCLADGPGDPTIGVCTLVGCATEADCPEPPPGGDAPVVCSDINADMVAEECSLDCTAGQTCPTGMSCFADFVCAWDVIPDPADVGFGDCANNPEEDVCLPDEVCFSDFPTTVGVCGTLGCSMGVECPDPPPGGNAPVICGDANGDMLADECFLDCGAGQTCPDGMSCFADAICAWDVIPGIGFGDCFNNPEADVCLADEICLSYGTTAVCMSFGCAVPSDCPEAPPGGTAPVICGDATGDMVAEECMLDCTALQTCPPGMSCFGNFICAWD